MITIKITVQTINGRTLCAIQGAGKPENMPEALFEQAFRVALPEVSAMVAAELKETGVAHYVRESTGAEADARVKAAEQEVKDAKSAGKN